VFWVNAKDVPAVRDDLIDLLALDEVIQLLDVGS
jgi:hypothetical protein